LAGSASRVRKYKAFDKPAHGLRLEPRQPDLILGTSGVLIDRFDRWVGDIGEFKGQRSRASTYITGCGG
jgi:hypothetical protein